MSDKTKKTIKINPELFKSGFSSSSDKTRKNREKRPKSNIPITLNESSLKKQFLTRIKEHKNKEKNDLDVSIKMNDESRHNSSVTNTRGQDELYESMNYLTLLSKKQKEDNEKKKYEKKKSEQNCKKYGLFKYI